MYNAGMIPEKAQFALYLNPIGVLFVGFTESVTRGRWLTLFEWATIAIWCLALFLISKVLLNSFRDSIVETL